MDFKIILRYGALAGLVILIVLVVSNLFLIDGNGIPKFEIAQYVGYGIMFLGLGVAIRMAVDAHYQRDANFSFGRGFFVGLLISLVAAVVYSLGWVIYFNLSAQAQLFPEQYLNYMVQSLEGSGKDAATIQKEVAAMRVMMDNYANSPLIQFGFTIMELLPVGVFISLVVAFFKRVKK